MDLDLLADSCEFAPPVVPPGTAYTLQESLTRLRCMTPINDPRQPSCSGTVYIGMFFDGTGNNREADYMTPPPLQRKHTNVVRLYHAYPDGVKRGTDGYYRYYIPGVGTPFPELRDDGKNGGGSFGSLGEARIIWGLLQVFNAVHSHVRGGDLIKTEQARVIARTVGGLGASATERRIWLQGRWQTRLRAALRNLSPRIDEIVIDVFGFSRGAAQARTWVNWLYDICEREGAADDPKALYRFAGIRLKVRFMGLLDTVASVGWAGLAAGTVADGNGHLSWAQGSLQIHSHVTRCAHYVAVHEVRACFPSDSVRVEGRYPHNAREWAWPGVHSDVGGGYAPKAQGKTDALARVPGYAMYREAMTHGVPLWDESYLKTDLPETYSDLIPSATAIRDFNAYLSASRAAPATLEQHHRQHMALYFRYRALAGEGYARHAFVGRAVGTGKMKENERAQLLKTQTDFMATLRHAHDVARRDPRQRVPGMLAREWAFELKVMPRRTMFWEDDPPPSSHPLHLRQALKGWRERLDPLEAVEMLHALPDLDLAAIIDALDPAGLPAAVPAFFDDYVHDSMASFIGTGIDEFEAVGNGLGLFKWRRLFFGDREDAFVREQVAAQNKTRQAEAATRRAEQARERVQQDQWRREAEAFARTRAR